MALKAERLTGITSEGAVARAAVPKPNAGIEQRRS